MTSWKKMPVVDDRPIPWDEMVAIEPRLADLLNEIKQERVGCCGVLPRWYGEGRWRNQGYQYRMMQLVGHTMTDIHPLLCGRSVYNRAYHTLLNALSEANPCTDDETCDDYSAWDYPVEEDQR